MRRKQGKPAKANGVGFCMGILYQYLFIPYVVYYACYLIFQCLKVMFMNAGLCMIFQACFGRVYDIFFVTLK